MAVSRTSSGVFAEDRQQLLWQGAVSSISKANTSSEIEVFGFQGPINDQ